MLHKDLTIWLYTVILQVLTEVMSSPSWITHGKLCSLHYAFISHQSSFGMQSASTIDSLDLLLERDYGNAMIQLSFRVQCDHNFYGRNCSTFCVHTDNSTGHHACGANGERVCLNGWRNPSENCLTRKCILISKLSLTYDI